MCFFMTITTPPIDTRLDLWQIQKLDENSVGIPYRTRGTAKDDQEL